MGRTATPPRSDLLAFLDRLRGSRVAVRRAETYRRRGWSADEVARAADRVAFELFARGIRPGDRVALWVGDGPLWTAAFFGILRAGGVAVPLDTSLSPAAVRESLSGLGIVAWCDERGVPRLDLDRPAIVLPVTPPHEPTIELPPMPPDAPDRPAEVVLTSGTSGDPHAVTVGHGNLRAVLDVLDRGIAEYRGWLRAAPRLRIACALPLSHLYGQVMGVFAPALLGADVVLVAPMPAPDLARSLRRERAWVLATVPRTLGLLARWLAARGAELWGEEGFERRLNRAAGLRWWSRARLFARLRLELGPRLVAVVSGGAPLDPEVAGLWRALGYAVVQGYGLTETAPLVTLDHPFDSRPGSLGKPLPGVEVRIGADQEILVRGANVAGGRVDAEGWLHTGDLGRIDAEGRLWFQGRRDEQFVTPAGVNVDSAAIAARLAAEPGVADALVFERPWGEPGVACAVLVTRPGSDPARAVAMANEDLPDAARIRAWRMWPEPDFPRTRTGKPRVAQVRAWLAAQDPVGAEGPVATLDPVTRMVAEISGVEGGALSPETRLGDALGSLDRVELATRIEMTYGVPLPPETAGPERRLGELAAAVAASSRADAETGGPVAAGLGATPGTSPKRAGVAGCPSGHSASPSPRARCGLSGARSSTWRRPESSAWPPSSPRF